MIIYKDYITGDELFTDIYPIKLVGPNKSIIRVQCERVTVTNDDSAIDAAIGANPSAEEAAETTEVSSKTEVNVVESHRLNEVPPFKKAAYKEKIKAYCGGLMAAKKEELERLEKDVQESKDEGESPKMIAIAEKAVADLKEGIAEFKNGFMADLKEEILEGFSKKEFQFFLGESHDDSGMYSLLTYPEEDTTGMKPVMYFIKFGIREQKV